MRKQQFHILMVDDVARYHKIYELAITSEIPSTLDFATDGLEALKKINSATKYDLMILDLNMPHLGGEDTLTEIRKNPNFDDMPIIILTGESACMNEEKLLDLGADDFIEKGSIPEIFVARLKTQLRYKQSLDQLTRMAVETDIFAAGVLHDIKSLEQHTILISNHITKLLQSDLLKNQDEILKFFRKLNEQAENISQYAQEIIKASQLNLSTFKFSEIDPEEIINWAYKILNPEINISESKLKIILDSDFDLVTADKNFLKFVMLTLFQLPLLSVETTTPQTITIMQNDSTSETSTLQLKFSFDPHFMMHKTKEERISEFLSPLSLPNKNFELVQKVVTEMYGKIWFKTNEECNTCVIFLQLPKFARS